MIQMIRTLAIGILIMASAAAFGGDKVDVWVVLSEPPVAASPAAGQLERVKQQQDRVMADLKALGATELARVTLANNALAVSIDSSKLPEAKRISGVRSVTAVRHIERDPLPVPPPR
jgi:hypothetical protein